MHAGFMMRQGCQLSVGLDVNPSSTTFGAVTRRQKLPPRHGTGARCPPRVAERRGGLVPDELAGGGVAGFPSQRMESAPGGAEIGRYLGGTGRRRGSRGCAAAVQEWWGKLSIEKHRPLVEAGRAVLHGAIEKSASTAPTPRARSRASGGGWGRRECTARRQAVHSAFPSNRRSIDVPLTTSERTRLTHPTEATPCRAAGTSSRRRPARRLRGSG